jgi:GWxTD domain-containing protein
MAIAINPRTFTKPCYFHTRMRYISLFVLLSFTASGQALRDINYSFLYNPNEPIEFHIEAVKLNEGWTVFFNLSLRDTTQDIGQFLIQWDIRKDLSEKEGVVVQPENISKKTGKHTIDGSINLPVVTDVRYLTARVLNNTVKRAWVFNKVLDPKSPTNGYLSLDNGPVLESFIKVNKAVTVVSSSDPQKIFSYYNDNFPAAVPGFSEGMGRVAKAMIVDSTFSYEANRPISFTQTGLYLIQKDTTSTEGFAFRVEEDYPRLAKVESLADPLIYVCTKQEFDRIKLAKVDKKAFDRVILSVTGDTERAKAFMRSYFRRVELANNFFTSYKEGWKTDRGMIYIIFGLPDQVFRFTDREVWTYKNNMYKITFDFVKSSTLFDPENFVLVRDKKFQETWYEVIDLWRNARF